MNYLRDRLYPLTRFNKKYYLFVAIMIELWIKINRNFHWFDETMISKLDYIRFSLLISVGLKMSLINMILNTIKGTFYGCISIFTSFIDFIENFIKNIFSGATSIFAWLKKKYCGKKISSSNCKFETSRIKKNPIDKNLSDSANNEIINKKNY